MPKGATRSTTPYRADHHHAVATAVSPTSARNVPELAGGHHEKWTAAAIQNAATRTNGCSGTMMAIADIFEALTNRPPSTSRAKLSRRRWKSWPRMRDERHIDAELFELFPAQRLWHSRQLRAALPATGAAGSGRYRALFAADMMAMRHSRYNRRQFFPNSPRTPTWSRISSAAI